MKLGIMAQIHISPCVESGIENGKSGCEADLSKQKVINHYYTLRAPNSYSNHLHYSFLSYLSFINTSNEL